MLTDFQNSFTDAFSRQLATKRLLNIPPYNNCVASVLGSRCLVKYKCKKN